MRSMRLRPTSQRPRTPRRPLLPTPLHQVQKAHEQTPQISNQITKEDESNEGTESTKEA